MTKEKLIELLPPFKNKVLRISDDQDTTEIVDEVLNAHSYFKSDYDAIAADFYDTDIYSLCVELWEFCKEFISYKVETDDSQTTRSPSAILLLGYGDCKHYAGFIGGVLDALTRQGLKIDWKYCFASYKKNDPEPQHVFIIVTLNSYNIWIDPVLDQFDEKEPTPDYYILKTPEMNNAINGLSRIYGNGRIGIASETVSLRTNAIPNLSFDVNGAFPYPQNPWPNYLGLDKYRDYYGDRNINEASIASAINEAIASGAQPGHTVTPDFVKWIYDNSIRSWNFYFAGGVDPNFNYTKFLPGSFTWKDASGKTQTITPPVYVITQDGRLTFDHDVKVDDYRNYLIHILTAGAQNFINQYDAAPFPLKPADLKIFSQSYTGNPGNTNADLLHEHRGASVVTTTLKTLNNVVNIVKDDLLKVTIAAPRNAFLLLIRLNLFHFASHLQEQIANGEWNNISKKWINLGGDPNKLLNTINEAAAKIGVDDPNASVDVTAADITSITDTNATPTSAPANVSGIGEPITATAIITAATPIIIAMLSWLKKSTVANQVAAGGLANLNASNPGANYTLDQHGNLLSNGKPVTITGGNSILTWIEDNPLIAAGAALGIYFLFFNKK